MRNELAGAPDYFGEIDLDNAIDNLASNAVPIETNEAWARFADLSLGDEDPSDYKYEGGDMNSACGAILYGAAERLCRALLEIDTQASGDGLAALTHATYDSAGSLVVHNPDCWITSDGTWGKVSDLEFVDLTDDRIAALVCAEG